jgi:integrase
MATKAGAIDRTEGVLIQSVKGFSRQGGLNVNERREQQDVPTRIEEVTYAYKPEDARKTVVVTRRNTKKRRPTIIDEKTAEKLKTPANDSPQGWRDALLMCLLLEHGLRASEAAILKVSDFDLAAGSVTFFRPKIKGTDNEWTTHKLTRAAKDAASYYINYLYPPTLKPDGRLVLATSRLLKDGSGGLLLERPLNRVRISERVAYLGKHLGVAKKLSAHDCRHTCATKMARLGYGVDELMAWFGWTSGQTAVRYVASAEVKERYRG